MVDWRNDPNRDWGRAELRAAEPFVAGERATWDIRYTVGELGIAVGGGIRIIPPTGGTLLWDVGKVTAYVDQPGVSLEVQCDKAWPRGYHHSSYPAVSVVVYGRPVEPGREIRVVFGDIGGYNSGRFLRGRVQDFAGAALFRVFVDPVGNARFSIERHRPQAYKPVQGDLVATVRPGRPDHVRLTLRNTSNGPEAVLAVEDRYDNVCDEARAELWACGLDGSIALPEKIALQPTDGGIKTFAFSCEPLDGPQWVSVVSPEHEVAGTSNPFQPDFHGEWNAYFGDLHVMTGAAGSANMLGNTETALQHARDVMGLDFSAVTNTGAKKCWESDREIFRRLNEPGEFVAMPAFEHGYRTGHKNIYFKTEDVDLPGGLTLEKLWEFVERERAMVISHHTNTHSETDPYEAWGSYDLGTVNPTFEPVIEICQNRGPFEKDKVGEDGVSFGGFGSSIQDALGRGLRLGFVGGTDNHRGRPGSHRSHQSGLDIDDFVAGGITCVLAKELTREAILDAIWKRRCYATTAVKMLLDLRVNDLVMGQEAEVGPANSDAFAARRIRVKAAGTRRIKHVAVVRNNVDVYVHPVGEMFCELEWIDDEDLAGLFDPSHRSVYYYVRVVQEDGNMGWASPVWLCHAPQS